MLDLWDVVGRVSPCPVLHPGLEGLSAAGAAQDVELHCPTGNVFKDRPSLFLWDVMPHSKTACSSQLLLRGCMSSCREGISTKRGDLFCFVFGGFILSP